MAITLALLVRGGCTKTTNCIRIQSLGLNEVDRFFGLYPNPANNQFTIHLMSGINNAEVELKSATGQLVYTANLINSKTEINTSAIDPGIYFVTVYQQGKMAKQTLVIQ